MSPEEHVAAEAAIRARKARAAGHGPQHLASAPSTANRITTGLIWLTAIGTLVALIMLR